MNNDTRKLIDRIRRYRPTGVTQVDVAAHVGEMWFLYLPKKIRQGIDSSRYRLHKDRPWICIAEYPNRYLFVASKTVHRDEDIDIHKDHVPFEYNGATRAAVMTEQIILTKEDFKNSKPSYMGELDPWLISLMECVYAACSNFSNIDVDQKVVEDLMDYVEWADPKVWTRSEDSSTAHKQQEQIPESKAEDNVLEETSDPDPEIESESFDNDDSISLTPENEGMHHSEDETVIDETFVELVREVIVGMVRSGKIKPQRTGDPSYNYNLFKHSKGMYSKKYIIIRNDVLKKVLSTLNFKGDKPRLVREMRKMGVIKSYTESGFYQKKLNGKNLNCIAFIIRDSDHITIPSVGKNNQIGTADKS